MTDEERIAKAIAWGEERLRDCKRTMQRYSDQRAFARARARDATDGESVAIAVMLQILRTGNTPS